MCRAHNVDPAKEPCVGRYRNWFNYRLSKAPDNIRSQQKEIKIALQKIFSNYAQTYKVRDQK